MKKGQAFPPVLILFVLVRNSIELGFSFAFQLEALRSTLVQ